MGQSTTLLGDHNGWAACHTHDPDPMSHPTGWRFEVPTLTIIKGGDEGGINSPNALTEINCACALAWNPSVNYI